jgi:cysteinyl-tRNA synthetase
MSAPSPTPLRLFNSLSREIEEFRPVHAGEARVYSCGPTVYNYPHIGNMRAYIFADTLGRVLRWKGYDLTHVINITDVGHLTDDGDAGEDKLEKMAATQRLTARQIADHYTEAYWADFRALNCHEPAHWSIATAFVPRMIEFAEGIADKHCYELPSGLYFDTSTVAHYGALARARTDEGESRIDPVDGKRNAADFAIWRRTPEGETRQMEWDSPWGRGAPGWHLECSVMSGDLLGFPFDIHTGGIDHREIHHPNEIAQNQAHCDADDSGARIWMHNNFLIDRTGKMSKSSGEFLRLQTLVDRGFHPLSYRLMCLQAHYRSELEFSWEGLLAAQTRLKRMVLGIAKFRALAALEPPAQAGMSLTQVDDAICNDLNTPRVLEIASSIADMPGYASDRLEAVLYCDEVLGLGLGRLDRADLRIRPATATLTEADIEARLAERKTARAAKDFATSDRIRDELSAAGVEVMDGDPLGWDWKPVI